MSYPNRFYQNGPGNGQSNGSSNGQGQQRAKKKERCKEIPLSAIHATDSQSLFITQDNNDVMIAGFIGTEKVSIPRNVFGNDNVLGRKVQGLIQDDFIYLRNEQGHLFKHGILGSDGRNAKEIYDPKLICSDGKKGGKIVNMSAGRKHIVAITDKGRAFGYGANNAGQLVSQGDSDYTSLTRILIGNRNNFVVDKNCRLFQGIFEEITDQIPGIGHNEAIRRGDTKSDYLCDVPLGYVNVSIIKTTLSKCLGTLSIPVSGNLRYVATYDTNIRGKVTASVRYDIDKIYIPYGNHKGIFTFEESCNKSVTKTLNLFAAPQSLVLFQTTVCKKTLVNQNIVEPISGSAIVEGQRETEVSVPILYDHRIEIPDLDFEKETGTIILFNKQDEDLDHCDRSEKSAGLASVHRTSVAGGKPVSLISSRSGSSSSVSASESESETELVPRVTASQPEEFDDFQSYLQERAKKVKAECPCSTGPVIPKKKDDCCGPEKCKEAVQINVSIVRDGYITCVERCSDVSFALAFDISLAGCQLPVLKPKKVLPQPHFVAVQAFGDNTALLDDQKTLWILGSFCDIRASYAELSNLPNCDKEISQVIKETTISFPADQIKCTQKKRVEKCKLPKCGSDNNSRSGSDEEDDSNSNKRAGFMPSFPDHPIFKGVNGGGSGHGSGNNSGNNSGSCSPNLNKRNNCRSEESEKIDLSKGTVTMTLAGGKHNACDLVAAIEKNLIASGTTNDDCAEEPKKCDRTIYLDVQSEYMSGGRSQSDRASGTPIGQSCLDKRTKIGSITLLNAKSCCKYISQGFADSIVEKTIDYCTKVEFDCESYHIGTSKKISTDEIVRLSFYDEGEHVVLYIDVSDQGAIVFQTNGAPCNHKFSIDASNQTTQFVLNYGPKIQSTELGRLKETLSLSASTPCIQYSNPHQNNLYNTYLQGGDRVCFTTSGPKDLRLAITSDLPTAIRSPKGKIVDFSLGNNNLIILIGASDCPSLVFALGENNFGQLGIGSKKTTVVWKQVNPSYFGNETVVGIYSAQTATFFLTVKDRIYASGKWKDLVCSTVPKRLTFDKCWKIRKLSISRDSIFGLSATGLLYGLGGNEVGQLGQGHLRKIECPTHLVVCDNKEDCEPDCDGKSDKDDKRNGSPGRCDKCHMKTCRCNDGANPGCGSSPQTSPRKGGPNNGNGMGQGPNGQGMGNGPNNGNMNRPNNSFSNPQYGQGPNRNQFNPGFNGGNNGFAQPMNSFGGPMNGFGGAPNGGGFGNTQNAPSFLPGFFRK